MSAEPPVARYALNLLVNDAGELLLLERALAARLGPGLWGLPAGKIEPGETAAAAALREMGEEIGPATKRRCCATWGRYATPTTAASTRFTCSIAAGWRARSSSTTNTAPSPGCRVSAFATTR
ncbi:MAG: NUDIX domain-containing protein [Proteobacteria bacterium]|nr:NUDIX domain-containing protein [Pseudomonadota bacterium]